MCIRDRSKDFWGTNIVQYYLGNISVSDLQERATKFAENSQQYAEILTETYFYLAKQKLNLGQIDEAAALFKLCLLYTSSQGVTKLNEKWIRRCGTWNRHGGLAYCRGDWCFRR